MILFIQIIEKFDFVYREYNESYVLCLNTGALHAVSLKCTDNTNHVVKYLIPIFFKLKDFIYCGLLLLKVFLLLFNSVIY